MTRRSGRNSHLVGRAESIARPAGVCQILAMRALLLLAFCALAASRMAWGNDSASIKAIQEDVRTVITAVEKGDVESMLDLTHPRILEITGGRAAMQGVLTMLMQQWKTKGLSYRLVEFPDPPTFHKGTENEFVLVPTHTVMVVPGKTIDSRQFQMGVRKLGETKWKYVDGAKLTPEFARMLFPDFPKEAVLPEKSKKEVKGA